MSPIPDMGSEIDLIREDFALLGVHNADSCVMAWLGKINTHTSQAMHTPTEVLAFVRAELYKNAAHMRSVGVQVPDSIPNPLPDDNDGEVTPPTAAQKRKDKKRRNRRATDNQSVQSNPVQPSNDQEVIPVINAVQGKDETVVSQELLDKRVAHLHLCTQANNAWREAVAQRKIAMMKWDEYVKEMHRRFSDLKAQKIV